MDFFRGLAEGFEGPQIFQKPPFWPGLAVHQHLGLSKKGGTRPLKKMASGLGHF